MEIIKTKRLSAKYPGSTFYAIIAKDLPNAKQNRLLEEEKRKLEAHIVKSYKDYTN